MTCGLRRRLERLEMLLWVAIPITGLVATACSGGSRGAEPDEIQDNLDETVVPIIDDTALAFRFLDDSTVLDKVGVSIQGSAAAGAWSEPDAAPPEPVEEDPSDATMGEDLAQFLRENVFTEDNYEGDGIYRVRGEDVCPEQPEQIFPPEEGQEPIPAGPDPDCVQTVDDMEIRIEVLIVDGGFDASLLVGPARAKPLKLELRDDSITVVVDLGAAKDAIQHAASVTGQQVELPDVLEGVVAATIRRDGEQAATVSLAIREDISFQMTTEDGPVSIDAAATDPLARISIDAIARHLEIQENAGPLLAELPYALVDAESGIEGTLRIDLAGATGTIVVDDGSDEITFAGLSLGDAQSRISLDDQTIFAIDLNADEGRSFDLTATPIDGGTRFAFDPGVHVVTTIDTRPVLALGEEVDPAADGDTYEIQLDGDAPTLEALDGDETTAGALKVASGRLRLSATGSDTITVEAGQCLLESEVLEGENPAFGAVEAGACP